MVKYLGIDQDHQRKNYRSGSAVNKSSISRLQGEIALYGVHAPPGVTLLGSVDDFESTPNVAASNLYIAPLNIDINFHFVANDTINFGAQKKILNEIIDAEGFGTLATPWGTFEVIKIVNHYNEYYYNNGVLINELHQPVVTFISKNGNALDITLPEGSPTTGTVATELIEFTRAESVKFPKNFPGSGIIPFLR